MEHQLITLNPFDISGMKHFLIGGLVDVDQSSGPHGLQIWHQPIMFYGEWSKTACMWENLNILKNLKMLSLKKWKVYRKNDVEGLVNQYPDDYNFAKT